MPSDAPELPDEPWTGEAPDQADPVLGQARGAQRSRARQPRVGVALNGERLDRLLLDCEVSNNRNFSADSFRVALALDEKLGATRSPEWFGAQDRIELELFAGLDPGQSPATRMIMGRVDDVEVDFAKRLVLLSGRDLTADLIETQTTEKWPNRTASEIATDLAGRHGLTPVVTDTARPSGTFYQHEHARLTDAVTEWTLLTYLAEQEGFDVFIRGKELHFGPPPDPRAAPRWELRYDAPGRERAFSTAPAGGLRVRRNLTVAQGIVVRVVSWNARQKRSFTITRRSSQGAGRGTSGRFATSAPHVFRVPGLTEEQAIREAETRLADLTRRERVLEAWDIPAEPDLDVRTIVALRGTGTSWDQDYILDQLDRSYSQDNGFAMRLRCRNLAPVSTAAI